MAEMERFMGAGPRNQWFQWIPERDLITDGARANAALASVRAPDCGVQPRMVAYQKNGCVSEN
jgi:hypothetical protein